MVIDNTVFMLLKLCCLSGIVITLTEGNTCLTESTTTFISTNLRHFSLENHVINSLHTGTLGRCALLCRENLFCKSVNFNHVTGSCDLNDAFMEDFPHDLSEQLNARYMQFVSTEQEVIQSLCATNPCHNGGTCVLGDCDSYDVISCECTSGYTGSNCQDQLASCGPLGPDPLNGYYMEFDGGYTVVFACNDDYVLSGSSTLICDVTTLTWSDVVPSCRHTNNTEVSAMLPVTYSVGLNQTFNSHQDLPLTSSTSVTSFTISNTVYIAVVSVATGCSLYRMTGDYFSFHQSISIEHLYDVEFAAINGLNYLFLAVERDATSYSTSSKIYIWQNNEFVYHADVTTMGARDWHYVADGGVHYFLLASYRNSDTNFAVTSSLFKWDDMLNTVTHLQDVDTVGCRSVTSFVDNGSTYVMFTSSEQNTGSIPVYRLDIDSLVLVSAKGVDVFSKYYYIGTFSYAGIYLIATSEINLSPYFFQWNIGTLVFEIKYGFSQLNHIRMVCPFKWQGRQFVIWVGRYSPSKVMVDQYNGIAYDSSYLEDFQDLTENTAKEPNINACHVIQVNGNIYAVLAPGDNLTPVRIYKWV